MKASVAAGDPLACAIVNSFVISDIAMYVSRETPTQTDERLVRVLSEAQLVVYEQPYTFVEAPAGCFPQHLLPKALAFIRDEEVWSALVPSSDPDRERFSIFRFHFTPALDNSGFVGWLASHLKARLGTGLMVVCGQNANRGGIFDYWGAPLSVGTEVLAELYALRQGKKADTVVRARSFAS